MAKVLRGDVRITGKGRVFLERATGTVVSDAVTIHAPMGTATSATSTLAADTSETITITNRYCTANSHVSAEVSTTGTGAPMVSSIVPSAGSFTVVVRNVNAATALTAVYKIYFMIMGSDLQDAN